MVSILALSGASEHDPGAIVVYPTIDPPRRAPSRHSARLAARSAPDQIEGAGATRAVFADPNALWWRASVTGAARRPRIAA